MASNDPGWGPRNNGGPPDLDEMLRQLNRKLRGLFGMEPPNNQPPSAKPDGAGTALIIPVFVLVLLVWAATGFYIVDQGSRGVVLRFGKHVDTTMPGPRWHWPWPIETREIVAMEQVRALTVGYRTVEGASIKTPELKEALMITDDGNIIDLQFGVQYKIKSPEDYLFFNRNMDDAVRGTAESAIREVVGKNRMDFVLNEGRTEIAVQVRALMQEILDRYHSGITITSINMQNAQAPREVQPAFADVVKARQDQVRQQNEGEAYANDVIPKARGTAAALLEEAAGYKARVINEAEGNASRFNQILAQYEKAPEVTRRRLYLDAQETILSSVSKVVVDQKGGGNLLYLPLDKLMAAAGASLPQTTAASATAAPAAAADAQRSRDALNTRDREDRP
ncbi:MAG: FtsH protease activity modulator HflK [Methylobacillus sp.]|jgi:membrane protease subunit HflK|nr:FtsH protease activity modulator HflK [Methylobacillus sp.]